jgi:hypothetical protein
MKLKTDSTEFSDFLHHPNCLANVRVHTFLRDGNSDAFEKLIRDLVVLYDVKRQRDLLVALCSHSIVTEYSPLLLDFGVTGKQVSEIAFHFYVEHDPLRWLAMLAKLAEGKDIQEVFQSIIEGLNAYSDCPKVILKYVIEFTCDEFLSAPLRRARAVIKKRLA